MDWIPNWPDNAWAAPPPPAPKQNLGNPVWVALAARTVQVHVPSGAKQAATQTLGPGGVFARMNQETTERVDAEIIGVYSTREAAEAAVGQWPSTPIRKSDRCSIHGPFTPGQGSAVEAVEGSRCRECGQPDNPAGTGLCGGCRNRQFEQLRNNAETREIVEEHLSAPVVRMPAGSTPQIMAPR